MKFVSPFIYPIGFIPVLAAVLLVSTFVERNIGFRDHTPGIGLDNFTTIYANGDVVTAITVLFVGFVIFGALSRAFIWLERVRVPTVSDHLRHCALLYVGLLLLLFMLIASYKSQAGGLGYGLGVIVFITGAYAAAIDALTLLLKRRRSSCINLGGNL